MEGCKKYSIKGVNVQEYQTQSMHIVRYKQSSRHVFHHEDIMCLGSQQALFDHYNFMELMFSLNIIHDWVHSNCYENCLKLWLFVLKLFSTFL